MRLLRPDIDEIDEVPDDCRQVIKAADALGIGEYDFFKLAYRHWSGREIDDKRLEKAFVAYMFYQKIPPWARHFARRVETLDLYGRLDPKALGAPPRRLPPPPENGRLSLALMAAAMIIFFTALANTDSDRIDTASVGCPGATGMRFFETWAYMISGKRPPPCDAYRRLPDELPGDDGGK